MQNRFYYASAQNIVACNSLNFAGGCVSCTAAIETASEGSDLSALETALMLAERSQLAYFLKRTTWYKQAKERHKKLRRLSLVTKTEKLHPKHVRQLKL